MASCILIPATRLAEESALWFLYSVMYHYYPYWFMYMPATNYNIKYFISAVFDESFNPLQMLNSDFTIQTKESLNCKAKMEENMYDKILKTIITDISCGCISNHIHIRNTNYYKHKNQCVKLGTHTT
jgi:hypothetical protein